MRLDLCLIILDPAPSGVSEMLALATEVFSHCRISINVVWTQHFCSPEFSKIAIGNCLTGQMTIEQLRLFEVREGAGARNIVIYFLEETIPASLGCAAHPPGRPAIIITRLANRWTLAHELAHVLGLQHVAEQDNLMTTKGTSSFGERVPLLWDYQIEILRSSPLLVQMDQPCRPSPS